jgi:glutamyl-tRNA synthetase
MTRAELIERFTLERVGASPATFDYRKLEWMNGVYLRALSPGEFAETLVRFLGERGYDWDEGLVRRAAPLVQEKIATLGEFPRFAGFFFERPEIKVDGAESSIVREARETLARTEPYVAEEIESSLRELAERLGLGPRQAFQPIRVAVTGSKVSPGLFETLELLGREEALARLDAAVSVVS